MPTLFFGGSFNPIHAGHLICARAVAEEAGYDGVTLVPAGQPPHKAESATVAGAHRLEMLRRAVDDPLFSVDEIEMGRAGPTYTFDTAQLLAARGQGPIHWLIGADMLLYLPQWHRAEELLEQLQFIVMARPGWSIDWAQLPPAFRVLEANVVEAPRLSISATGIRQRVAAGRSIRYLTPDAVVEYIADHGLYR